VDASATTDSALDRLAGKPIRAVIVLLALCFAVYLPGVIRLPAVDRTEVVYAETTRDMLARGAIADPRYGETVYQFRPIGTYWAQAKVAWLAGPKHARDITVYRLPGMIAVSLAVIALYWLAVPLVGTSAAFIAAALFAVAPLTVLVAHLAIAESLSLLPATIAMLALLRIYTAPPDQPTRGLALVFWAALGLSGLINALLVPILVTVTLIALGFMERDFAWVKRLLVWPGLVLALALASPWMIVRYLQDGVPFAGLDVQELLAALGGAQDMKLRAMPGTFVLALLLGALPGTALFAPAFLALWRDRDQKIARFLVTWVLGYVVYLELLSSKPGTYMVQTLFPAAAIAVAMLVVRADGKAPAPRFHALAWPPLAAAFALILFAAPFAAVRKWPDAWLWLPIAIVAGLFAWSAAEGRAGRLMRWAVSGVAALGLFAVTLIAGILPSIDVIWPAREIQRALRDCPPAPIGVFGFNEPSSIFVLGRDARLSTKEGLARLADGQESGLAILTERWSAANRSALRSAQDAKLQPIACIRAINTMRGCVLDLKVVGNSTASACAIPPEYACSDASALQARASPLKACD
jgi:4-amino-4-deoxy-L-arabinose transferase-like glycosyltransferase